MAKRRDRRLVQSSDRREPRGDPSTQVDQFSESAASDRKLIAIFILFFIVIPAVSVLVYRIKYAPNTYGTESHARQDGRVKTDLKYEEILSVSSLFLDHYNVLLFWLLNWP